MLIYIVAKFTDEQCTTINQSTGGCFDPRVFVNFLLLLWLCMYVCIWQDCLWSRGMYVAIAYQDAFLPLLSTCRTNHRGSWAGRVCSRPLPGYQTALGLPLHTDPVQWWQTRLVASTWVRESTTGACLSQSPSRVWVFVMFIMQQFTAGPQDTQH